MPPFFLFFLCIFCQILFSFLLFSHRKKRFLERGGVQTDYIIIDVDDDFDEQHDFVFDESERGRLKKKTGVL